VAGGGWRSVSGISSTISVRARRALLRATSHCTYCAATPLRIARAQRGNGAGASAAACRGCVSWHRTRHGIMGMARTAA